MSRGLLCLLSMLLLPVQAVASIDVVVTIKPLQLIAEALLKDGGTVRLLIPAAGSPHHYTMTPSDRLALADADLIVYVGETLETEFHQAIDSLRAKTPVLEVLRLDRPLVRLPLQSGHGQNTAAGSALIDPHLWLDSRNARHIARAMHDTIVQIEPDSGEALGLNLARFEARLDELDATVAELLSSLSNRQEALKLSAASAPPASDYVIYHDAIGYFESRYGHQHALVLVDDPEIQPGMRHLLETRDAVARIRPACLLTDNTARPRVIETVMSGRFRMVQLDLLGDRLQPGAGYPELLGALAGDFAYCLHGERD